MNRKPDSPTLKHQERDSGCQLFGTSGCHLCEQAETLLLPFVQRGLSVELMDITENSDWLESYGLRIPVLRRRDNDSELDWPFNEEQIESFLKA